MFANYKKLGRGVWGIIFEYLNYHSQIAFIQVCHYFRQYCITVIPKQYLYPNTICAFPHLRSIALGGNFKITDISNLSKLEILDLNENDTISDISMLSIHTLNLRSNRKITNINALAPTLRILDLHGNAGITDISALTQLESLNISFNGNISDISMLTNLRRLTITHNSAIRKYPSTLEWLSITECENIKDINHLQSLKVLKIGRNLFEDINGLVALEALDISNRSKPLNLDYIAHGIKTLNLSFSTIVVNLALFTNIHTLILANNTTIETIPPECAKTLRHLNLCGSCAVTDISVFTQLISLNLERNNNITDISTLSNLQSLNLNYNNTIGEIGGLKQLRELRLLSNTIIEDLRPLCHLSRVYINRLSIICRRSRNIPDHVYCDMV